MIEVEAITGSVLVQDQGRHGFGHLGVSPSGAADRAALARANAALGNPPTAAALEVMGAVRLRTHEDLLLAVAGPRTEVELDGVATTARVLAVAAGSVVSVAAPTWGLRTYLAVRGGLDVPPVLTSRSTDTLSGLGPEPVREGARIQALPAVAPLPTMPPDDAAAVTPGSLAMLDALPGPRADWVRDVDALYTRPWRVSHLADRVGTRLEGEPLVRAVTDELPSEGVVRGSVQVPPSGEPVVLGPDHPVTGGYPVVAVLTPSASDALAQLRAGTVVRFRRVSAD